MINSLVSENLPKPPQGIKLIKKLHLNLGTHSHGGAEGLSRGL